LEAIEIVADAKDVIVAHGNDAASANATADRSFYWISFLICEANPPEQSMPSNLVHRFADQSAAFASRL
jgi:hypothetical protein